jgi:[ribosomal protein S5]-alanine N-acetyltransferase
MNEAGRMTMQTLTTARLVLEPQAAVHAPAMFEVLRDPAIYDYENEPPPSLDWLRERFARLESRQSRDGKQQWLNWVIGLPSGELIGYVQATVTGDGRAAIAYVLHSGHWGQGLAGEAVEAMALELVARYDVHTLSAVLKRENLRSLRLLQRFAFAEAAPEMHAALGAEPDELLMVRNLRGG